ncbi:MAG TPA: ATP-binding protein [Xanthobacteraceae bacterium]|nr:ATP-binding protein [Xanthobacteraceae bacterium]
MHAKLRAFMPGHISGQIAIIIVASVVLIHVVLTTAFFLTRHGPPPQAERDELATLIELVAATPAPARETLIAQMNRTFPRLDLARADRWPDAQDAAIDRPADAPPAGREVAGLAHRLGPDFHVARIGTETPGGPAAPHAIAVRFKDGAVVTARLLPMPAPPAFGSPIAITLMAVALSVTLLGLWAAWGLVGPLRRFAWAAENFDPNGEIALLPERGPYEVRAAARALNRMRERIRSLIDDRTQMLAAVSHDLRTPITRLRLRCEFIEDEAARSQMLEELSQMGAMVESVLYFLRDGRRREATTTIDLATSLQTICDQFADTGHDVSYDGPDHVVIRAYAEELHRAITNLIDNAVRHGGKTDVGVTLALSVVTIAIEDDGPGIAEADKEAMFKPFVRGDAARGMNGQSGFGLGLSIARTVIEAHGGTLALRDRSPRGLVAQVTLPRDGADAAKLSRPSGQ